eukprot:COSAG01_NODE_5561_length_4184_cov_13.309670_3_plen_55_part_00
MCVEVVGVVRGCGSVGGVAAAASSSCRRRSFGTPHAPGWLVGTIAQAHNIELVL